MTPRTDAVIMQIFEDVKRNAETGFPYQLPEERMEDLCKQLETELQQARAENERLRKELDEKLSPYIAKALRGEIRRLREALQKIEGACLKDEYFSNFLHQGFWHAHHVDIIWRYNGNDIRREADWLKDIWYVIKERAREALNS